MRDSCDETEVASKTAGRRPSPLGVIWGCVYWILCLVVAFEVLVYFCHTPGIDGYHKSMFSDTIRGAAHTVRSLFEILKTRSGMEV